MLDQGLLTLWAGIPLLSHAMPAVGAFGGILSDRLIEPLDVGKPCAGNSCRYGRSVFAHREMCTACADGNARKAVFTDIDFDARQNLDGLAKSPSHEEQPPFLFAKMVLHRVWIVVVPCIKNRV